MPEVPDQRGALRNVPIGGGCWKNKKSKPSGSDTAHVRGHQVRKHYKKVVWSVSIVEKAILRWRHKRSGLQRFQFGKTIGDTEKGFAKTDEYDFLRLGRKQKVAAVEKALERVQSMVRYPEARDQ